MEDAADVVRRLLAFLEPGETEAAVALLTADIVWKNTGMPTFRGKKVVAMLRDMEARGIGFKADLHHIASNGDIVLTDRTDYLTYKRWETASAAPSRSATGRSRCGTTTSRWATWSPARSAA